MQIDQSNESVLDTEVGHLLPRYMDYEYAQMFDATIRDRKEYAAFVNKNIPELEASVNTIVSTHNNDSTVSWVGGSRAWKSVYDRYYSSQPLDEITTASIRSAGNYDVFMIHNDASSYKALLDDVNAAVKAIHAGLTKNKILIDHYSVNLVYPKGKIPGRGKPLNKDLQMCALFPCMSIAIELTSRPSPRRNTVTSSLPELNEKLLVYVEVIYLKRINMQLFKQQLFDSQSKLSPIGLLFFSNFLTNSRAEKTLNIDAYRTRFMERMITDSGDTLARVYHQVAMIYHQVFSVNFGIKSFDTMFVQDMYLKAVIALHEKTHKYNIVDYYTYVLMEKLRPVINSCLIYIAAFLKSKFDVFNAHLVVVGGDAMRRYIPDVAATADIDTKVYYKKGKAKIFDKLLALMVLMVTLLENNYEFSKKDTYKITEKVNIFEGTGSYTVELPKIQLLGYEENDRMSLSSASSRESGSLIGDEFNNSIFRLRIIEESSEFPVTLFSIDANIPIRVEIKGKVLYETKITIPVFDLVMQYKEDALKYADIHDIHRDIPIASMSFLINDLKSTYTDEAKAQMRFFGFKKDKDERRLKKLEGLLRTSPSTYYDKLDRVRLAQAGFVTDDGNILREDIHNDMVEYRCKFKNMMAVNRRGKMLKHKMPFSRIKMDKIHKKCTINFDWNQEILKHIDLRLGLMEFDHNRGLSIAIRTGGGKKRDDCGGARRLSVRKTEDLRKRAYDYIVKKYGESCMKRKDTLAFDRYLSEFMVHAR